MREAIYGWMKQLAVFYIFITAVMNFLPEEKYARYIRYFTGILLILLVLGPLLSLLHMEEAVAERFFRETWKGKKVQWEQSGDLQSGYLCRAYEEEIGTQIREKLLDLGVSALRVEVRLQEGKELEIFRIAVYTEQQLPDGRKEELRDELGRTYQIPGERMDFFP